MIADLKRDTIDWEEERAQTGNRGQYFRMKKATHPVSSNTDFRLSRTRNYRQAKGQSRPLATPPIMGGPLPRTDSIPIPPGRHDRRDDTRAGFVDASPRPPGQFPPNYPPERTSSRQQVPLEGGYDEPSRSADMYPRYEPSGATAQSQGRGPSMNPSFSSTTNTQNVSQPRNPTVPAPQSGNQSEQIREDVMKMVMRKLREEGHSSITQGQLDRAVDEALRRIQQQQAPPPYTKTPNTQPSTTDTPGFSRTATAGPMPDSGYSQYRY
jgi:hypothetical protein